VADRAGSTRLAHPDDHSCACQMLTAAVSSSAPVPQEPLSVLSNLRFPSSAEAIGAVGVIADAVASKSIIIGGREN
jgi:hypothetical protein